MILCSAGAGGGLLGKVQGAFSSGGAFLMNTALRRKKAKGCCAESHCAAASFSMCAPVCYSGLLLAGEML
jgi:hypothetical protein